MQRRLKCCRGGYTVWSNILSSGNAALWEMFREIQVLMLAKQKRVHIASITKIQNCLKHTKSHAKHLPRSQPIFLSQDLPYVSKNMVEICPFHILAYMILKHMKYRN